MGKRGNGEGSVYQAKDGRWVAAVSLESGKRKVFYGKTRQEAAGKLTAALKDKQDGLPLPGDRLTVGRYLDEWLAARKPRLGGRTYQSYEETCRLHLKSALGKKALTKLTPSDVQRLVNSKLETGLSPVRAGYIRVVLRAALSQALKWGLVTRNVAALAESPRVPRKQVDPFTPEEAKVFLESAKGDRLYALYTVALAIGLRRAEALGLRWEDIDFKSGTLRVRRTLQRLNREYRLVEAKSERSHRTVALPTFAIAALRDHRTRQLEERLAAGSEWQDWGLAFTTATGGPLDGSWTTRHFQRLIAEAGLPRQRFHDLRHGAASLLLAQGVHPRTVMELLGHSRISITMDLYSHVTARLQREAANKMDALFAADS
jgi:integrase